MKIAIIISIIFLALSIGLNSQSLTKEDFLPDSTYSPYFSSLLKDGDYFYLSAMLGRLIQIDENNQKLEHYFGFYRYNPDGSFDTLTKVFREGYYFPSNFSSEVNNSFGGYNFGSTVSGMKEFTLSKLDALGKEIYYKHYEYCYMFKATANDGILEYNDSLYLPAYSSKMISIVTFDKELTTHKVRKLIDIPYDQFDESRGLKIFKQSTGFAISGAIMKGYKSKFIIILTDNNFNIIKQSEYTNEFETTYLMDVTYVNDQFYCLFKCKQKSMIL
jgi:hypothetical protein